MANGFVQSQRSVLAVNPARTAASELLVEGQPADDDLSLFPHRYLARLLARLAR